MLLRIIILVAILISFNVSASDKMIGVLIMEPSQVNEVIEFSSVVGINPTTEQEFRSYLDEVDNRVDLIVSIGQNFLTNRGVYEYNQYVLDIITLTLEDSNFNRKIVFAIDEPMWRVRTACFEGEQAACNDVDANYSQSLNALLEISDYLRANVPNSEIMHIESYAELYMQYDNASEFYLMYHAEHIAFNCYGQLDNCGGAFGVPMLDQMLYIQSMYGQIKLNNSNAEIFLFTGLFVDGVFFETEEDMLQQLNDYVNLFTTYREYLSGIGGYSWGSFFEVGRDFIGARDLESKAYVSIVLQQLTN